MDISIIVPVYNVEKYLEKCIQSLLNQNINNYEILLINDGSTDNSLSICEKYKIKDPQKIRLINKKNEGLSETRNTGIKLAKGKYIMFVDSDDWIMSNCLYDISKLCINNTDIILGNYIIFNEEMDNDYFTKQSIIKNEEMSKENKWKTYVFNKKICDTAWRFIVKKEFLMKYNLFFTKDLYHEDNEWVPKIICCARDAIIYDKAFYYYRRRINSITSSKKIKNHMDMLEICKLLKIFGEKLEDKNQKQYIFECITSCIYTTIKFSKNMLKKEKEKIKSKIGENNFREYLYSNYKIKFLCNMLGIYYGIWMYDSLISIKQKIMKR